MVRSFHWVLAFAALAAVLSCNGGGSGTGSGDGGICPAGQMEQGGQCVASCSGTACGGACCGATEACVAPGQCSAAEACSSTATCPGGLACIAGKCATANGACSLQMNSISGDSRAPDLQADVAPNVADCPGTLGLLLRVWNRGAAPVTAGVPIALYQSQAGGALLAVGHTSAAIEPGGSTMVTIAVSPAPPAQIDVAVVLNDDGTGQGVVGECDTTNNTVLVSGISCPVRRCGYPGRPCSGRW
jgi:hypothetical protein